MTMIQIIRGAYGLKTPTGRTKLVFAKDANKGVCEVPPDEAKRLIDLGVALAVENAPAASATSNAPAASAGHVYRKAELEAMKYADLQALAKELGVKPCNQPTKKLIAAVLAIQKAVEKARAEAAEETQQENAANETPTEAPTEEPEDDEAEDGEQPPELTIPEPLA